MWSRAVWVEGDVEVEGIIPVSWIQDNKVRWPPGANAEKYLKNMKEPRDTWRSFQLIKVKKQSENKQECIEFNLTTTAETDSSEDESQKRRKKPKAFTDCVLGEAIITTDYETSSVVHTKGPVVHTKAQDTDEHALPKPPKKTTLKQKKKKNPETDDEVPDPPNSMYTESASESNGEVISPKEKRTSLFSNSTTEEESDASVESFYTKKFKKTPINHQQKVSSKRSHSNISTLYSSDEEPVTKKNENSKNSEKHLFPMETAKFQKRVLYLLTDLKKSVNELGKKYEPQDSDFHIVKIISKLQFKKIERELEDIEAKTMLTSQLERIGGLDLKHTVTRVMDRLFSNEIMSLMNMNGNRGKIAFRKLHLYECVTDAVLKSSSGTNHDVNNCLKSVLKYAPDRKGGAGRKMMN